MPGPKTAPEALAWVQAAIAGGSYLVLEEDKGHFSRRLNLYGLDMLDVFELVENATVCTPYDKRAPRRDGTQWRVSGPDVSKEQTISIGVETFLDRKRRRCALVTIFREEE